jgi:glutamate formiminotransferase
MNLAATFSPCSRSTPQLFFSRMQTLVECVPNFSEGRDTAKVDAIVDAMKGDGVFLLDREMDPDHNRCVITIVGDREAVPEAAIRGRGQSGGTH